MIQDDGNKSEDKPEGGFFGYLSYKEYLDDAPRRQRQRGNGDGG